MHAETGGNTSLHKHIVSDPDTEGPQWPTLLRTDSGGLWLPDQSRTELQ